MSRRFLTQYVKAATILLHAKALPVALMGLPKPQNLEAQDLKRKEAKDLKRSIPKERSKAKDSKPTIQSSSF